MILPRLTLPRHLSGNAVAAAVVTATACLAFGSGWFSNPGSGGVTATQVARNDWRDLRPRTESAAKDLAVLKNLAPWGIPAVDPAAAAAAAAGAAAGGAGLAGTSAEGPWRVTGVARLGDNYLAVLTRTPNGQPAKSSFLKVGEKLPDGRAIAAIDAASIEVETSAGRQRIRLYWPKT